MSTHDETCEGGDCRCFARKLRTIQFGNVTDIAERRIERQQEKDLPAYARLRANGLQPKSTRGCAELEGRAHAQIEVEMGKLIDPPLLRRHGGEIAEGMQMAREAGYGVTDVRQWKDKAVAG